MVPCATETQDERQKDKGNSGRHGELTPELVVPETVDPSKHSTSVGPSQERTRVSEPLTPDTSLLSPNNLFLSVRRPCNRLAPEKETVHLRVTWVKCPLCRLRTQPGKGKVVPRPRRLWFRDCTGGPGPTETEIILFSTLVPVSFSLVLRLEFSSRPESQRLGYTQTSQTASLVSLPNHEDQG